MTPILVSMCALLAVKMSAGDAHAADDFYSDKTTGIVGFLADAKTSRLDVGPIPAEAMENGRCLSGRLQLRADR